VCGLRCTTLASELTPPPKCSMDCPGEEQRHGMTSRAAGSTAAQGAGQRGVPTGLPRVAGLGGREDGLGGRRARPSLAWARWRRGDGAGTQLAQGAAVRRGTACTRVRTRVRLLKPERGIGNATRRHGGVTAEPGSTPWAAVSTAPAVGRRARDGCTAWFGQARASVAAKESVPLSLAIACAACPATARPGRRERPRKRRCGLVSGGACACAGVHLGAKASDPRGPLRERERDHGTASRPGAARCGMRR
jgi:hypothetical protein